MSFRLKVKACAEQPNPLSIVAAVILRINNGPNAWGDGNVVVDLKAIERFNVIGSISLAAHITALDTPRTKATGILSS